MYDGVTEGPHPVTSDILLFVSENEQISPPGRILIPAASGASFCTEPHDIVFYYTLYGNVQPDWNAMRTLHCTRLDPVIRELPQPISQSTVMLHPDDRR